MFLNTFNMFYLIHTLTAHTQISLLHKVIIFNFFPYQMHILLLENNFLSQKKQKYTKKKKDKPCL